MEKRNSCFILISTEILRVFLISASPVSREMEFYFLQGIRAPAVKTIIQGNLLRRTSSQDQELALKNPAYLKQTYIKIYNDNLMKLQVAYRDILKYI